MLFQPQGLEWSLVYDPLFLSRLEVFQRLVRDYTSSFTLNLKQRRDRGFHVFRELIQFLFKLGRRCIRPANLPIESDMLSILSLSIPDVKALSISDFLARSNLETRLEATCKVQAEAEKGKRKYEGLKLDEISSKIKEEFGRSARSYVIFLFKGTQGLTRFTSDIVEGLGSFDLEIMLVEPLENAAYCFKQLFTSFRLRGLLQPEEETVYTEEYMSFLDILRQSHPGVQQPKLLIADTIEFVCGQESFKSRLYLRRIFRLSCLCLDEPRMSFPLVKFGFQRTDDPLSPMFDVIAPIQSYLGNVPQGLDVLTSDSSITRFIELEQSFGNAGLSDVYSPWDSIDHFGRVQIREALGTSSSGQTTTSSVDGTAKGTGLKPFAVPKPYKRRSHLLTGKELADSASRLVASCSKD